MKKWRTNFVLLAFFLAGLAILSRLYFLQIAAGSYYKDRQERQHFSSKTPGPERGKIYFKDKDENLRLAASTKRGFLVYLNPKELRENKAEPESVYLEIKNIFEKDKIKIDKEKFLSLASKTDDPFEVLLRRVEKERALEVEALKIRGVGIAPDQWRFYPAGRLASQTLGFVGYKNDELIGRYGLEESYEEFLKGKTGYGKGKGILGEILNLGKKVLMAPSQVSDLVLTIDPALQAFFENKIDEILKKWDGDLAGGIIIEPLTGKILSLASKPDFDPNYYNEISDLGVFKNPAVQNRYEFGSIFKPLTMAAGLNENVITSKTTYFDKGFLELNGRRIENYDKKGRGEADMQRVLNESLNTGAVFIQQKLGKEKFYDYLKKFGLAQPTNTGIKGEIKGDLRNLEKGKDVEYATASYGQGVSATPLGLVRALSSLGNGGYLVEPYIVEKIKRPGLPDESFAPRLEDLEKNRLLAKETSEEITRMLVKVVDEALVQGKEKMKNYTAAAKTGTAEMPSEEARGYSGKYFHTIFVYAPAFDPKFLILLYLENPKGVRYASESLAHPVMEIARFALNYYEAAPDR